ncbi:hypothetical protein HDE_02225 [Halotydeus destructor]|nr:hypothetical protein HDE_02225 [Halotydeus destructor]
MAAIVDNNNNSFPVFLMSYEKRQSLPAVQHDAILFDKYRYISKVEKPVKPKKIKRRVYKNNPHDYKRVFLGVDFIKADAISLAAVLTVFLGFCLLIGGSFLMKDKDDYFKLFDFKFDQPQNYSLCLGLIMVVCGLVLGVLRVLFFDPNFCSHCYRSLRGRKPRPVAPPSSVYVMSNSSFSEDF